MFIYFHDQRCTDERLSFAKYLTCLQDKRESGKKIDGHMKDYDKYSLHSNRNA